MREQTYRLQVKEIQQERTIAEQEAMSEWVFRQYPTILDD
jgi:hypothetical protein